VVVKSLRAIEPIVYAATFYYMLKVLAGVSIEVLHFPFTITAIWVTALKVSIDYFEAIRMLQTEHLFNVLLL